ncbi:MAG TPA: GNAT family N-acetyltransferase [Isosphaeraceae bacterium]|nr:GNAT family N-acetyltransferase [Isosphaeraceae bacterium]
MIDLPSDPPPALTIEVMTSDDWAVVRSIYEEGIATGNATFETKAPDWETWDQGRRADCRLVIRSQEQILGWATLSSVSSRPVYAGVAEVSLYVAALARGQGVGTMLMMALIGLQSGPGSGPSRDRFSPRTPPVCPLSGGAGFERSGGGSR